LCVSRPISGDVKLYIGHSPSRFWVLNCKNHFIEEERREKEMLKTKTWRDGPKILREKGGLETRKCELN
jgi:hypothetical protein